MEKELDERGRIFAGFDERVDRGDDRRFVVGVGDAEPVTGGLQDLAVAFSRLDERVGDGWNVALGFFLAASFGEKRDELRFQVIHKVRGKRPEVHRNRCVFREFAAAAIQGVAADFSIRFAFDFHEFFDAGEEAVFVRSADPAIHVAVVRERVSQGITDHRVVGFSGGTGLEKVGGALVGVVAIKVVRIDHREVFPDQIASSADRVSGAPRFDAAFGNGESRRKVAEILVGVIDLDAISETGSDALLKSVRKVLPNDKDHPAKTGADRVENRVVQHGFAVRAHRVHLFQAAVSAAHASGENEKGRFHEEKIDARSGPSQGNLWANAIRPAIPESSGEKSRMTWPVRAGWRGGFGLFRN